MSSAINEPQATVDRWMEDGLANFSKGDFAQAEEFFRRTLQTRPGHSDALHLLGEIARHRGRSAEAIELLRDAIAAKGSIAAFHFSLGCALQAEERIEEAAAAYREVVALDDGNSQAHELLGGALASLGDRAGAIAAFDSALRIDPEMVSAHVNRGLVLLSLGDYARGWEGFEWRWKRPESQTIRKMFSQTWWDGSNLAGRTILLFAEQGLGDAIQFIRYAPIVAGTGARVVVDCHPPLKALFRQVSGVAQVLEDDSDIARHDLCCPLMSLPRLLGTTLDTVPAEVPYLSVGKNVVSDWRRKLAVKDERLVGLCWKGNPLYKNDRNRSLRLAELRPLLACPGVRFVSLQRDLDEEESAISAELENFTHPGADFKDTAEIIGALDLVISVDTAWAHWAGAIGKPLWLLLPLVPHWCWLLDRKDNPWYPTARLFRQTRRDDWEDVIESVEHEIVRFLR